MPLPREAAKLGLGGAGNQTPALGVQRRQLKGLASRVPYVL